MASPNHHQGIPHNGSPHQPSPLPNILGYHCLTREETDLLYHFHQFYLRVNGYLIHDSYIVYNICSNIRLYASTFFSKARGYARDEDGSR